MEQKKENRKQLSSIICSRSGLTLVETVLSAVIIGVVFVAFAGYQIGFIRQVEMRADAYTAKKSAQMTLSEIEAAIQDASRILKAGENILELECRSIYDNDEALEKVRFTYADRKLLREIARSGDAYSPAEIMLHEINCFSANSATIQDQFVRLDYDRVLPVIAEPILDPTVQVTNKVADLGGVDSDLSTAYVAAEERLTVNSGSFYKSITVSPDLKKDGLSAQVYFHPEENGNEFRPLIYGEESPSGDQVSVVFLEDQRIVLRRIENSLVVDTTATLSWNSRENYLVAFSFEDGNCTAMIDRGAGWERVGVISSGEIEQKKIHLQVTAANAKGSFDDVLIQYPFIELMLEIQVNEKPLVMQGGAKFLQQ